MLVHPLIDKLNQMKLKGMARAFVEVLNQKEWDHLSFEEQLGHLIDREYEDQQNRSLTRRLQVAKLRYQANLEDVNFDPKRGLDKALIRELGQDRWLKRHQNVLITGATGAGKSYLACALGHRACLNGYRVIYFRMPRLLREMNVAKGDGTYVKLLAKWSRMDLVILDDWGITPLTAEACRDILELLEDRHQKSSTIVTSQVPAELWHKTMKSQTLADAIMDRLFHQAYRLSLGGDTMRDHAPLS